MVVVSTDSAAHSWTDTYLSLLKMAQRPTKSQLQKLDDLRTRFWGLFQLFSAVCLTSRFIKT